MSDPGAAPNTRRTWGRGRTVLFYASLALNLLVVGVVVGALAFGGRPSARTNVDGPFPLLRALPDEDRRAVFRELRKGRPEGSERPVQSLRRSRDLVQLLRAEEFDADRFDALLNDQSMAAFDRAASGREALIAVLSEMSVSERHAYADRLVDMLRKPHRKPPEGGPR